MIRETYPCGEFTAHIINPNNIRINAKGKGARNYQRLQNITDLVKELILIPEDWDGEKNFTSVLKAVKVRIFDDRIKITLNYDHDDKQKHPCSEHDHPHKAYSTDYIENGKCWHISPSIMGGYNEYEHEGVNSLDELLKDSAPYKMLRRWYENIVEYNHEYTFWEDDSYLFD